MEHFNFPIAFRELSESLSKKLEANWNGGDLSSDGGLLLLAQADQQLGLSSSIAAALRDSRSRGRIRYDERHLTLARMLCIAGGYADGNDLNELRRDPALLIALGERPAEGQVASQSSVSRFENRVRKSQVMRAAYRVARCAIDRLPHDTKKVIIEFDGSDDACHGQQELCSFNGYYKSTCYMPLLVHIQGDDGRRWLLGVLLRPGQSGAGTGFQPILRRVLRLVRDRFPEVEITVRCDSGFDTDANYACCEDENVHYVIAMSSNPRLSHRAAAHERVALAKYRARKQELIRARAAEKSDSMASEPPEANPNVSGALAASESTADWAADWEKNYPVDTALAEAESVTYGGFGYRTVDGTVTHRVVVQTKVAGGKILTRFVATSYQPESFQPPAGGWKAQRIFDYYACRGEQENRIKEWKLDLEGGRTSCHRYLANQFRLVLHSAAMLLMNAIQSLITQDKAPSRWTVGTLRLQVIKVAVRAKVSTRRILLEYSSSYAQKALFARINLALSSGALCRGRAPAT